MKRSYLAISIIFLVLLVDQIIKFWIKTNYAISHGFDMLGLSWAKIHFVENEGMAFGMELGGDYGKLLLTLFRMIAVGFIGYYLYSLIKTKASKGLVISISLVFAGAMGNIIDSIFYGVLFSASTNTTIAEFLPAAGGYATALHGHVVDMFYFPMFEGRYPEWMPFIGGKAYLFFRPVFNIADSAITIGVLTILLFQRRIFSQQQPEEKISTEPVVIEKADSEEQSNQS